ncbi:MAG: hypothetical protein HQ517_15305 [SAR324 cluster bacterium]|nr:hypothetical protein [SAR324 cluster bacterium]
MRNFLLVGMLIILVFSMPACKDLLTSHNINLDGTEHGEKLYNGEKNCTSCHGVNLNGNGPVPGCYSCHDALWSNSFHSRVWGGVGHRSGMFAVSDCGSCHGGNSLQGSRSRPSCYECHDDVWTTLAIHTINEEGAYHAPGLNSPLENCVSCHGSDLRGTANAQSCYQCHGNEWDENGND